MVETFLININCSKILDEGDESQYTMHIDSTKMSIVYELVEWIRWMFSLDDCLYLTHNNSVIHELEDIQVLSKLKNFEVKPCGRSHCAHKKMYRTLLKNLNLFIDWSGSKVHRYFLHKLSQMDQKISEEDSVMTPISSASFSKDQESFVDFQKKKKDSTKKISPKNNNFFLSESRTPGSGKNSLLMKKKSLTETLDSRLGANDFSTAEVSSGADKRIFPSFTNSSEEKFGTEVGEMTCENSVRHKDITPVNNNESGVDNKLKPSEEKSKNFSKPFSKRYVKPFSLGETLLSIREDFAKQNSQLPKVTPLNNHPTPEKDFEDEVVDCNNLLACEDETNIPKKRKRIRRRKSKKQNPELQEFELPSFDKSNTDCSSDAFKLNSYVKPSHIRFEDEDEEEDNAMETDCYEDETVRREINKSTAATVSKAVPQKLRIPTNESNQSSDVALVTSPLKSTEDQTNCHSVIDNQVIAEEKLINSDDQHCVDVYKSNAVTESPNADVTAPNLSRLLSFKEKFKNALVIERFY